MERCFSTGIFTCIYAYLYSLSFVHIKAAIKLKLVKGLPPHNMQNIGSELLTIPSAVFQVSLLYGISEKNKILWKKVKEKQLEAANKNMWNNNLQAKLFWFQHINNNNQIMKPCIRQAKQPLESEDVWIHKERVRSSNLAKGSTWAQRVSHMQSHGISGTFLLETIKHMWLSLQRWGSNVFL